MVATARRAGVKAEVRFVNICLLDRRQSFMNRDSSEVPRTFGSPTVAVADGQLPYCGSKIIKRGNMKSLPPSPKSQK